MKNKLRRTLLTILLSLICICIIENRVSSQDSSNTKRKIEANICGTPEIRSLLSHEARWEEFYTNCLNIDNVNYISVKGAIQYLLEPSTRRDIRYHENVAALFERLRYIYNYSGICEIFKSTTTSRYGNQFDDVGRMFGCLPTAEHLFEQTAQQMELSVSSLKSLQRSISSNNSRIVVLSLILILITGSILATTIFRRSTEDQRFHEQMLPNRILVNVSHENPQNIDARLNESVNSINRVINMIEEIRINQSKNYNDDINTIPKESNPFSTHDDQPGMTHVYPTEKQDHQINTIKDYHLLNKPSTIELANILFSQNREDLIDDKLRELITDDIIEYGCIIYPTREARDPLSNTDYNKEITYTTTGIENLDNQLHFIIYHVKDENNTYIVPCKYKGKLPPRQFEQYYNYPNAILSLSKIERPTTVRIRHMNIKNTREASMAFTIKDKGSVS